MEKQKKEQAAEPASKMKRTLNKMGYMFKDLTEYCEDFIDFSKKSHGPVLEIGAAYGFVSLKVANSGTKIWVNDLDPRHLESIKKEASDYQNSFISTIPGHFPKKLDFPKESFTAIFSSNVFHFLEKEDVEQGIKKMFDWLKPGGKVFITAGSPYAYLWKEFIPIFEKKIRNGERWPGYTDDFSIFKNNARLKELPAFFHFFSPEILASSFKECGFIPEKSGYSPRKDWPEDFQLDGRETAGLIAYKP